jgi:hypothetical protein
MFSAVCSSQELALFPNCISLVIRAATRGKQCEDLMNDDLRHQALANWRKLFAMPASLISTEARYDKLLMAADHMERAGLISSDEWRKLAQQAGTSFASTAECMGGTGAIYDHLSRKGLSKT